MHHLRRRALASSPQPDPVAGLIDIPLPPAISLWPQTWPLRIALAVATAGLLFGLWRLTYWWYRNRYRRAALTELAAIQRTWNPENPAGTSIALASLIRRTALAAFPRGQVASLAGQAWLAFLDRTANTRDFSEGVGRVLAREAYQPIADDPRALFGIIRHWIKAHHA
ncbi:hypothetical protein B2M20_10685 [Nitrobacter vulgaris]|uniref:DUF4381 domain-containing protein n=1 Tax=Nitrobacter vulgaris TaxID=29421 RepID=A0A1V4HZG3_NITVU|nr:hypothetical protein B2M20_10685 [Nitrobacter vulgaris]